MHVRIDAGPGESGDMARARRREVDRGPRLVPADPVRIRGGAGVRRVRFQHRTGQRRRGDHAVQEHLDVAHGHARLGDHLPLIVLPRHTLQEHHGLLGITPFGRPDQNREMRSHRQMPIFLAPAKAASVCGVAAASRNVVMP